MLHESINPQKSYDGPMPNIAVVLKGELARLARKETRAEVAELRKASSQYRSHIAALRRRIEAMERQLKRLSKTSGRAKAAAESMLPPASKYASTAPMVAALDKPSTPSAAPTSTAASPPGWSLAMSKASLTSAKAKRSTPVKVSVPSTPDRSTTEATLPLAAPMS